MWLQPERNVDFAYSPILACSGTNVDELPKLSNAERTDLACAVTRERRHRPLAGELSSVQAAGDHAQGLPPALTPLMLDAPVTPIPCYTCSSTRLESALLGCFGLQLLCVQGLGGESPDSATPPADTAAHGRKRPEPDGPSAPTTSVDTPPPPGIAEA
jgi:hypothetical protein